MAGRMSCTLHGSSSEILPKNKIQVSPCLIMQQSKRYCTIVMLVHKVEIENLIIIGL